MTAVVKTIEELADDLAQMADQIVRTPPEQITPDAWGELGLAVVRYQQAREA